MDSPPASSKISTPEHLFPIVRHLSGRLTPVLLAHPITPNQITLASLATGLAASWCLLGGHASALAGCGLFILCQVLDNCDGEVARLKRMQSRLGGMLDDLSDGLVHSTLFISLGLRASSGRGGRLLFWCGVAAAAGVVLEYTFGLLRGREADGEQGSATGSPEPQSTAPDPTGRVTPFDVAGETTWADKAVYVLRVLIDADFCLMLPFFVIAGLEWLLLPSAAIGNQVYWASAFYEKARRYHA
jgi:phosphatidylglycerophosphate synthase